MVRRIRFAAAFLLLSFTLFLGYSMPVTAEENGCLEECCPEEQNSQSLKLTEPPVQGPEVLEYQLVLKRLGFFKALPDGVFGTSMAEAIKNFQKAHGLPADGVLGPSTKRMLARQFEEGPASTASREAPRGTVRLVIDVDKRTLTVYDEGKKFKEFPVAVGKDETPTPIGVWQVSRKAKNWGTGFGTRWLGLNVPWGIYGIHGTNKPWSIGSFASHGCIRMFNSDVEALYEWVKPGTTVRIVGEIYSPFYELRPTVHKGHRGSAVMMVQKGLIDEGYLQGEVDGIFGQSTEDALKKLQKDRGFEVTGQVTLDIWPVLGL